MMPGMSKEATDWGWDWALLKINTYILSMFPIAMREILLAVSIKWMDGLIEYGLRPKCGPNWFKNWCSSNFGDTTKDEVYYTPIYYTLSHFSRLFDLVLKSETVIDHNDVMVTAAENPDGSRVLVVFNTQDHPVNLRLNLQGENAQWTIAAQAIQTVVIPN